MASTKQWQVQANRQINCNTDSSSGNVQQNILITKAYASMYLTDTSVYKWAGMGAFASLLVGAGIASGKGVDIIYDRFFSDGDQQTSTNKRRNLTNLDNMLIAGNKAVYRDIYWQHLVHRDAGVDALLELLQEPSFIAKRKSMLIEGWKTIGEGQRKKDPAKIWQGNALLLEYEQKITLQPIYSRYSQLANQLSYIMVSPLPDHYAPFKLSYPNGSIADVTARWGWISRILLPEWKRQDASSLEARIRMIAMGHIPARAVCPAD